MMQRKPMSRGAGFKRPQYIRTPPSAPTRGRGGRITMVGAEVLNACKTVAHRNRHLLDMARGQYCLLRVPGVCIGGTETTVACHSNLGIHGKAGARKANDEYHAAGCFACHRWLDQGSADGEIKALIFMGAHLEQVGIWRALVADTSQPAKNRDAAQWALDHLNGSPVGPLEAPL